MITDRISKIKQTLYVYSQLLYDGKGVPSGIPLWNGCLLQS